MNNEMTLAKAMTYCFEDIQDNEDKRKRFSNKEAANTYSESLKHLWPDEIGLVYGPFINAKINGYWWEVSYERVTPAPDSKSSF